MEYSDYGPMHFQIDDFVEEKLKGSNMEKYTLITAYMMKDGVETLYKEYNL